METLAVLALFAAGSCLTAIQLRLRMGGERPRLGGSLDHASRRLALAALILFGAGMTILVVGIYVGRITLP